MPSPAMPKFEEIAARLPDGLVRAGYRVVYLAALVFCFIFRPAARSAAAALWHRDRLLLVRTSYRRDYTLPGGLCRRGEAFRQAAARELAEETGIALPSARLSPAGVFRGRFEFRRDRAALFESRLPAAPKVRIDRREVVWAGFLRVARIRRLPHSPLLAFYLKRHGQDGP